MVGSAVLEAIVARLGAHEIAAESPSAGIDD